MNIFKKQILSIAILAGIGLGFVPTQAQAEKIRVSEMTKKERIAFFAKSAVSSTGAFIGSMFLARLIANKYNDAIAMVAGVCGGLGLAVATAYVYNDSIIYDAYVDKEQTSGTLIGAGVSFGVLAAFIRLTS